MLGHFEGQNGIALAIDDGGGQDSLQRIIERQNTIFPLKKGQFMLNSAPLLDGRCRRDGEAIVKTFFEVIDKCRHVGRFDTFVGADFVEQFAGGPQIGSCHTHKFEVFEQTVIEGKALAFVID